MFTSPSTAPSSARNFTHHFMHDDVLLRCPFFDLGRHAIAMGGVLDRFTKLIKSSLSFFPMAFSSNSTVGND